MPVIMQLTDTLQYDLYFSSKRRSIALQIKQGRLIVRAPSHTDPSVITQLIRAKQRWIEKHLSSYPISVKPDYIKTNRLPVLDSTIALNVSIGSVSEVVSSHTGVDVKVSRRCKPDNFDKNIKQILEQWYKTFATDWFANQVKHWQAPMQVCAGNLVIGNWKTRWGYCKANGELGFNWRLIMAPSFVAKYVVVHELAHLRFMHHGAEFWQFISAHYPNYQQAIDWLKQHHALLEL